MTTALFAQDEQRITEVDGRTYEVRDHGMPPTVDAGASVHLLPVEGLMGWSRVGGNANMNGRLFYKFYGQACEASEAGSFQARQAIFGQGRDIRVLV